MKIAFITFYFEPDLCAGSFRNSSLFKELIVQLKESDTVDVITTQPNRYDSYSVEAKDIEKVGDNATIYRIKLPKHGSGIIGQIKSFTMFYLKVLKLIKDKEYSLVYASSSRLFTAFLGAKIARKNKAKLYLDIRDIFRETITDLYKNKMLKMVLNMIIKPIENYTFRRADHINLVSKGFLSYFEKYKKSFSFYTNGIDDLFLNHIKNQYDLDKNKRDVRTIVYAGNFGGGQGLHNLIPKAASELRDKFMFILIGDGGARKKLEQEILNKNIKNIILKPPVKRERLLKEYQQADYLFLHLNNEKAFERVLPSKLFEYATFNKPIIAGVAGYAKSFLEENMANVIIFEPNNVEDFILKLKTYRHKNQDRKDFIKDFSRNNINKKMIQSILSI